MLLFSLFHLDPDDLTLSMVQVTHSPDSNISFTNNFSLNILFDVDSGITLTSQSSESPASIDVYLSVLRTAKYINHRIIPAETSIDPIELIVTDIQGGVSDPHSTLICFSDVDTPPILDLNGPGNAGINFITEYIESSLPIPVIILNCI